jgi:hypothetical protein
MLRTTIQTLEVQRATIATLKGISGAMLAPLTKSGQKADVSAMAMPPFPMPPPEPTAEPEPEPAPARKSSQRRHRPKPPHAPTVTEAPLNPTAWWNTLQDQFTKIAASAAAGAAAADQQAPGKKASKTAGARRAAKAGKGR